MKNIREMIDPTILYDKFGWPYGCSSLFTPNHRDIDDIYNLYMDDNSSEVFDVYDIFFMFDIYIRREIKGQSQ